MITVILNCKKCGQPIEASLSRKKGRRSAPISGVMSVRARASGWPRRENRSKNGPDRMLLRILITKRLTRHATTSSGNAVSRMRAWTKAYCPRVLRSCAGPV